jgi:hypothetical protein
MSDQPNDMNKNKNAIRLAVGAALGSALGIITAVRTLSGARGQAQATLAPPESAKRVGAADEIIPMGEARLGDTAKHPVPHPDHHPDWEQLPAAHLPRPTYWPIVLAVGIMFLAWGIVTTIAITIIGLALLALGLGGWIGELRHGE